MLQKALTLSHLFSFTRLRRRGGLNCGSYDWFKVVSRRDLPYFQYHKSYTLQILLAHGYKVLTVDDGFVIYDHRIIIE